jgi:hypothetical protein
VIEKITCELLRIVAMKESEGIAMRDGDFGLSKVGKQVDRKKNQKSFTNIELRLIPFVRLMLCSLMLFYCSRIAQATASMGTCIYNRPIRPTGLHARQS